MRYRLLFIFALLFSTNAHAYREFHYWLWGNFYRVIEPDNFLTFPRRPALLLLHGCTQNSSDILDLTEISNAVDKHGFYVIVPEQHTSRNSDSCWNWFLPENQTAMYYGEPTFLRDLAINLLPFHAIDPNQIHLAGISAGGSMAVNLFALYPDSFAGLVTIGAAPFGIASDVKTALNLMSNGTNLTPEELGRRMHQARPIQLKTKRKFLIAHGDADIVVNHKNAESIFGALKIHADYLDDGKQNKSVKFKSTTKTVTGTQKHRATTTKTLSNKDWTIQQLTIHGLGHKWPGSNSKSVHADPYGPSLTNHLIQYLEL